MSKSMLHMRTLDMSAAAERVARFRMLPLLACHADSARLGRNGHPCSR